MSSNKTQTHCACLLRKDCQFNFPGLDILSSHHWCRNNNECVGGTPFKISGLCLDGEDTVCRYCEDVINLNPASADNRDDYDDLTEKSITTLADYRNDIPDADELCLIMRIYADKSRKDTRSGILNLFYFFLCSMIGQEISREEDRSRTRFIYENCALRYLAYLNNKGATFLLNSTGLLDCYSPCAFPEDVYDFLASKSMTEYNILNDSKAKTGSTNNSLTDSAKLAGLTVEDISNKSKCYNIMFGKHIWDTFKSAKEECNNTLTPYWTPLKSGENYSGKFLQIRESLWPIEEESKIAKRAYNSKVCKDSRKSGNAMEIKAILNQEIQKKMVLYYTNLHIF